MVKDQMASSLEQSFWMIRRVNIARRAKKESSQIFDLSHRPIVSLSQTPKGKGDAQVGW